MKPSSSRSAITLRMVAGERSRPGVARQRARADRLALGDVALDKRLEQDLGALVEHAIHCTLGACPSYAASRLVKPSFRRIALIGKPRSAGDRRASLRELRRLPASSAAAKCCSSGDRRRARQRAARTTRARRSADLAVVVGGDGTMLAAARSLVRHRVPLVGVNQGRLGFMTDIGHDDMQSRHRRDPRRQVHGRGAHAARRRDRARAASRCCARIALNEAVVGKGAQGRLIEFELRIDGEFVYTLRADGLIVATPTGSTAYALSAQGPILHPAVPALALVPLSPHTLSARPVSVSDRSVIEITLRARASMRARTSTASRSPTCRRATAWCSGARPTRVRFVHPPGYRYFAMLREKLRWSEALDKAARRTSHAARARHPGLRHRRAVGLELGAGFTRAHRRDRRRQVDPGRCDRAAGRRARRRRRWCAKAPSAPSSPRNSTCRCRSVAAWLDEHELRGRSGPPASCGAPSTAPAARAASSTATRRRSRSCKEAASGWSTSTASTRTSRCCGRRRSATLLDAHAGAEALARETAEAYRAWKRLRGGRARGAEEVRRSAKPSAPSSRERVADLKKLAPREGEWDAGRAPSRSGCQHGSSLLAGAQSSLEALAEAEGACARAALGASRRGCARCPSTTTACSRSSRCSNRPKRRRARRCASCATTPRASTSTRRRCARPRRASRRCTPRRASYRVRPEELPELAGRARSKRLQRARAVR